MDMTVMEYFNKNCVVEDLKQISSYNDYWYSSYKFVLQNQNTKVSDLSPKQLSWLHKIVRGLMDSHIS